MDKLISDGPANISFPFRTVRIGTKKAFCVGADNPVKFDRKRIKFTVNTKPERESPCEIKKVVIPCKHITSFKSYLSRGCPVIWLQTSEECTRHIRKLLGMKRGNCPSYYYDPESKLMAEKFIGIVINADSIPYHDIYNLKRVLTEVCEDKKISVDVFYEKISQSQCNSMLVEISGIGDRIESLQKKAAASENFDTRKNMHSDLKISSSLLPENYVSPLQSNATKKKHQQTQKQTEKVKSSAPLSPPPPIVQTPPMKNDSMVDNKQKSPVVSPGTAQRNRARKSIPKSSRIISLESQLDEIRAKVGLSPDKVINVPSANDIALPDDTGNTKIEDDTASVASSTGSSTQVRKKRPKDPFLWKGRTKKRYKKSSSDARTSYLAPGGNSPKVGETLKTPLSTISASVNSVPPTSASQENNLKKQSHEQISGFLSTVEKCKCLEKSPHILHTGHYPIKCMGLDSVDARLSQCINYVKTPMMMRPSRNSPQLALCEEHRERMLRHECCPGCGMFCAGGTYLICVQSTECPHRFHKDCMLLHHQTKHCLHCVGPMSTVREVTVEPRQEYKLRWLVAGLDSNKMERKRLNENRQKTARMGHKPSYDNVYIEDGIVKTLRLGVTVDTSELPQGKDRELLEEALCSFFETSHKKLKIHPKNVSQVIQHGDLMKLVQFFHEAEEVDFKNLLKNPTTLNKAVMNGNVPIVYLLKLVGVKMNLKDGKGKTALFYAEEREHVRLINFLIENGADIGFKDSEGMTCMHQAAKNGRIVSCAALLSNDSNIVNMPDDGGWTPIVWATEHRHTSTARYLEHFGADVTKTDKEKNMCIHWAALSGNLELLIMCLQRHCDINFRNKHGDTALHVAARQDHAECVLCLTNWGVDHTITNNEGKTALECTFPDTDSQVLLKFKHKVAEAMSKPGQHDNQPRNKIMSADLSKGFENLPVSCINSVDDAPCPTEASDGFHYVTANVHMSSETIVKNPTNKMQSCYCYNECSDGSCLCGVMSSKCWYNKQGQLISEFDFVDAPFIVECSETCWCPPSCHNRVVQKGIKYNLQVHRTRSMGWSVRTLDTIPRGAFVCEYVGELISDAEADIREDDSYLFDLENSNEEIFCIDARYYGNVSRFINHLCHPNLMPLRVFIDHHDKRFPRLAYFSTREIKAGEELGFDYGNRFWDIKCRSFTCGCGSPQCKYSEEAYRLRREAEEKNKLAAAEATGSST